MSRGTVPVRSWVGSSGTGRWWVEVTAVEGAVVAPDDLPQGASCPPRSQLTRRCGHGLTAGVESGWREGRRVKVNNAIDVPLRFLQTMREVASERNTTTFVPVPIDLVAPFLSARQTPLSP